MGIECISRHHGSCVAHQQVKGVKQMGPKELAAKILEGVARGAGTVAMFAATESMELKAPKPPKVSQEEKITAAVMTALKEQGLVK
jgi:hypothetical protein